MTKIIFIVTRRVELIPKGFTEQEKLNINQTLIKNCKLNWQKFGYKKTNIDELCKGSGISKGAFYLFFDTKEDLFLQTLKSVQINLYSKIEEILSETPNKYGVAKALKKIYRVYYESPFMYETTSEDFISFFNKLSIQQQSELNSLSYEGAKTMLRKPFLTLKISEDLALSVLSTTLLTISLRDKMLSHSFDVFDFMVDHLIEKIFE
ncbi:TetR/AcrR family transcriptional regulator [Metabacillus halosaccharovorans]|uniref:TetR/AcrR family transcriptional regulator n=1 Tax=Metabacillus halosaccharovorans TaxID=930124 RepID=UPI001C5730CD|nr:TetR/AcrR family transcriptional regulator [Metabacillus halosaccharovorans]